MFDFRLLTCFLVIASVQDIGCVLRAEPPVCEGNSVHLSCDRGKVVTILRASYGRTAGEEVCPHPSIHDLHCHASTSLGTMKARCDGRASCTVAATNNVFGDPCVGTYKYLDVTYDCVDGHYRACEGSDVQLNCGSSEKNITILEANYGRIAGAEVCPHPSIRDLHCHAFNSLTTMRARCNGRSACAVPATNGVFGDPCVGTYKYLDVSYNCI